MVRNAPERAVGAMTQDFDAEAHAGRLARDGFTVIEDFLSPEDLADALREALETLLDGEAGEAANDLAAIIDTLEHLGEPEPKSVVHRLLWRVGLPHVYQCGRRVSRAHLFSLNLSFFHFLLT